MDYIFALSFGMFSKHFSKSSQQNPAKISSVFLFCQNSQKHLLNVLVKYQYHLTNIAVIITESALTVKVEQTIE